MRFFAFIILKKFFDDLFCMPQCVYVTCYTMLITATDKWFNAKSRVTSNMGD